MKQYITAEVEQNEKGMVAIASSNAKDRHGEIVSVDGWDLKNFKKNPVILWAHNHEQLPVGAAKNIWIEGAGKRAKLMFEPIFHEVTDLARAIKRLFEDGVLRSFSVGFRPLDAEGDTYTKQELLEISAVNVGANADAMMLAYKDMRDEFDEETLEMAGIPVGIIEKMGSFEDKLKLVETKADSAVKGLEHLNPHLGRNGRVAKDRLNMAKTAVKSADQLMKDGEYSAKTVKAIKRANEMLIVSLKGEINGKNQRASRKSEE